MEKLAEKQRKENKKKTLKISNKSLISQDFLYIFILWKEKRQIVKLDSYDFTKKLFKSSHQREVIRLSTGYDCHWYIVSSTITEIVE